MVDVAVKSLSFLVEGARTNWFGFGCPAFCVQPSFSSVLLACLLGFLAGIAVTVWAFWTFHSFGFSLSGPVPAPPSSRYSVLAEYLNEHSSQSRRRRSWPHLGDLRISISGPASQATDLLRSITSGQLGASSAASSAASVAPSFDLVSQPPASHRPPRGYPERLEHRDTILATFRPCPDYLLEGSSKLVGSKLCGADRVRRAYLAGQWAKAVRDKRVPSPNRTPPIELKNRFYAILSGGIGLDRPILFSTLRPRTGPPLGTVCQIPQLSATVSRARQRLAPIWQEQTSSSLTSSHDDGADGWSGSHSGRFGNGVGYHGALRAHFSARWRFGWDHRDLRFGGYEASRGLLAVPSDAIPQQVLDLGESDVADGIFGPSMEVSVPGVVLDNGTMAVTEEVVAVVLVDCTLDVIPLLSHQEPFAEVDYGFSEAVPQALPSPDPLLAEALHWVSSATGRVNFYSAESEAEVVSPKPRKPKRQARAWRRRAYTYRKRWSTAEAANSCNSVSVVGAPHVGNPPVDAHGSPTKDDFPTTPWTFGTLDGCGQAEDSPGARGGEGRKRTSRPSQLGKGRPCPEPCPYNFGFSNSSSRTRSDDRSINPGSGDQHQRCSRKSPFAERAGDAPWNLPLRFCRLCQEGWPRPAAARWLQGDLRHDVPRKIRGVGAAAVPSYDCPGFPDGGQHPGGERHDSSSGCHHRARSSRSWKAGDCKPALLAGRRAGRSLHDKTGRFLVAEPILCTPGRPEVDHLRVSVHEGDGRDHIEAPGVCAEAFYGSRSRRRRSKETAQGSSKEERWKRTIQGRGRGDLSCDDLPLPCLRSSTEMHAAPDGRMNPLEQEIEFTTWGLCLSRWILNSGTSSAWHLRKSFTAEWRGSSSSTATFPLLFLIQDVSHRVGPNFRREGLRCSPRGGLFMWPSSSWTSCTLVAMPPRRSLGDGRMLGSSFYVACGFVRELLPIAPGRSGPELGACLHQLERFLEVNPELAAAYRSHEAASFQDDPALFPWKISTADALQEPRC